jgi:coenzyme F420 hydrogenase subunit beta
VDLLRDVIQEGLCCGCGTCAGICPVNAIQMEKTTGLYRPRIDEHSCINCGLCFRSCPGHSVNFEELSLQVFNEPYKGNSIGNYLSCYVGYSTDDSIRFESASGGLVTQLLIFALENNIIDGVITTRMRKDSPLETEAFIARTRDEIIEASKSKYCPVAANICLKEILNENGRFAAVGLPCHIHGIRKAEQVNRELRKKIILKFGLLCSHTVDFEGTRFIINKMGFNEDDIASINYRGEGWPGAMSIKTKAGVCSRLPLLGSWHAYWIVFSSFFFTPVRCTMCPDEAAELADISFGDAWLPEFKKETRGMSILVSRTIMGEELLTQAKAAKKISLTRTSIEKVEQSQRINLKIKKSDLPFRLSCLRMVGRSTPKFAPLISNRKSVRSAIRAFYMYFGIKAAYNKIFQSLLTYTPLPLIRLYYGIYRALSRI